MKIKAPFKIEIYRVTRGRTFFGLFRPVAGLGMQLCWRFAISNRTAFKA